jgi:PBP1b-binding outer membrane lipoprotein LpoB
MGRKVGSALPRQSDRHAGKQEQRMKSTKMILATFLLMAISGCAKSETERAVSPTPMTTTSNPVFVAYVFKPNTHTMAALYLDKEGTMPAANPVVADTNGSFKFFTNGAVEVKIRRQ